MRVTLLGLLALAVVKVAAGAASADWKGLPYFTPVGNQAQLLTDGSWAGADAVRMPANARPFPPSNPYFSKLKRELIWGATCGTARERRTFSKTFTLPGDPISGTYIFEYGGGRDRPYEGATLTVNGVLIARLGRTAGFEPGRGGPYAVRDDLTAAARSAFRHGPNTVRIDVTKAPLKPGERCSIPREGRYVGVLADVFLQFGGDLRTQPPRIPRTVQRNVTNGQNVPVQGVVTFTNGGPSTALEGTAQINISGPGTSAIQELQVDAPFACERQQVQLSCTYREFRAGQSASIRYIGGTKVNLGFFRGGSERILTIASIQTPSNFPDPKGLNNSQKSEVVLCTADATDPACK